MNQTQNIPWKRISVEALAIVVSILLAFSIDAWWDERQARDEELVVLTALRDEFEAKRELLDYERLYHQAILDSTRELQRLAALPAEDRERQAVDKLIAKVIWFGDESDWDTAVLDGLISSGDISLISNRELRRRLSSWPTTIARIKLYYWQDAQFLLDVWDPFMFANSYLPPIVNANTSVPGHPEISYHSEEVADSGDYDNVNLLSNPEFVNLLIGKAFKQRNILNIGFLGLEDNLDQTIRMLDWELNK